MPCEEEFDREKKTKNRNKILFSLLLSGVIGSAVLAGNSDNEVKKPNMYDEENSFDELNKYMIVDGEAVQVYKGENIALAINNKTKKIDEYIYYDYHSLVFKCYELRTGDFIYSSILGDQEGEDYYRSIIDNSTIVNFVDIGDYIEDETCKEWYTLDEIEELKPKILQAVNKINQIKKVKTLSR